ncbi:putative beta-galactosidase A [Tricladium varicosporioides]|nr:putative beta-galactosidase A [Hymenoscyphus varicosporioides]
MVHGKRAMIMSGEMHPWRMPSTSLWIDVFEKIKALGFTAVSFYVHWGLVEYAKDDINFSGFLSLEPFFEAARKTGLYLIARPGPYINAETTGGGTPGWGTRVPGAWRTTNQTYFDAMENYVRSVSRILAKEQITNGGVLVLVQPENEYSYCFESPNCHVPWPQPAYMELLQNMMREEGIVVPTITSNYAPGSGVGEVDIRGYDNYPLSFICNATSTWPDNKLPTNFWEANHNRSGGNPNSIMEMQAGAHGRWGWFTPDDCATLTGSDFERVFYKNYVSFSTTVLNLYMMYGGTNWGGIASPATITSYDYGSPIRENRLLTREKYSELKLLAQFLLVSPAYLTTKPLNQIPNTINGSTFTNNLNLATTQLADVVGNKTVFWVVRHNAYNSLEKSVYRLRVPTSKGTVEVPVLGGDLSLSGRDSKIHVSDYSIGSDTTALYSSGEILTWKQFSSKTVLVIHGFPGETHETAFIVPDQPKLEVKQIAGSALRNSTITSDIVTINYQIPATSSQTVISIGLKLQVVIVNRNTAFDFWTPSWNSGNSSAIVKSPYLIRSADLSNAGVLMIRGDLNQTKVEVEVFADDDINSVSFNGKNVDVRRSGYGSLKFDMTSSDLKVELPNLEKLDWKYIDGLPELRRDFDDSKWTSANKTDSNNPRKPTTPTSLYSSDYGYHTNNILWRGHFIATGTETNFTAEIQGGSAFSAAVYIDDKQISYFGGIYNVAAANLTGVVPALEKGSKHVITVLQDHMGLEQNYGPGGDLHKVPRGILNYRFEGGNGTNVTWKVTGNLGGEHYLDRVRGPLNEGGLYAERQGFHQPSVDTSSWSKGGPAEGLKEAGVRFYYTTFNLDVPRGLDVPISINIKNSTVPTTYRALIYVNGWQFGKYVNNMGPQTSFPVPEGIFNHHGTNTLALSLWNMESNGAKVEGLSLKADGVVETSMWEVEMMPSPIWTKREQAY